MFLLMERIRTEAIEGGKLEASVLIKRAFDGTGKLSMGKANRLCQQIDRITSFSVLYELHKSVRLPMIDVVALLWRIKEIEQAELGNEVDDLFKDSVENIQFGVDWQVELNRRVLKKHKVSLHRSSLGELRLVALSLTNQLKITLEQFANAYIPLFADDELMVEVLEQKLPLFWEAVINLHQIIGGLLGTSRFLVDSLTHSLQIIGSPVKVNQEIIEQLSVSLVRAVKSLQILRDLFYSGEKLFAAGAKLMEALDKACVYPNYHLKLLESLKRADIMMGNGDVHENADFTANASVLKRNYLEQNYQEAERFWAVQTASGPSAVQTVTEKQEECQITFRWEPASGLVPRRILVLIRLALDNDFLQEAEDLMRVYILASNLVEMKEYNQLGSFYRDWRDVEERIAGQIQKNRLGILRLVK